MNNKFDKWLEYYKKENEATTGSLRHYYRKLKELHRDRITVTQSIRSQFDSALDTKKALTDYIDTNISLTEKKVEKFLEDELPNFHD